MSNQQINAFEGVTFKVVAQIVDITYNGVEIIASKGNGILGKMMEPIINKDSKQTQSVITTRSSEVGKLTFEEVRDGKAIPYGTVRAQLIAEHAELNAKVKDFHQNLNTLKEGLLNGSTTAYADSAALDGIKKAMLPFNIGRVLKVKLQARMYSPQQIAGWNKVKTGGSSKVGTLYTFYINYKEGMDIQAVVDRLADMFRTGTTGSDTKVVTQAYQARVVKLDDDKIVITPAAPATVVQLPLEDGKIETLPIESIKSANKQFKGSALFAKKTALGKSSIFDK